MAKLAVEEDRVPFALRKFLFAHAGRVLGVAAWVGRATMAANQHVVWVERGGTHVKVKLRDAEARPLHNRAPKTKPFAEARVPIEPPPSSLPPRGCPVAAMRRRRTPNPQVARGRPPLLPSMRLPLV